MFAEPDLIELTRGGRVESLHAGAVAIARPNGELVLALGTVGRPVYPRSAVKAFQCIALVETGAPDRYGFGQAEIALACASHSGSTAHVALAASMLARAGQTEAALECGAHVPMAEASAAEFHRAGLPATQLHNNCSGKHAGMVAACVHCGDPIGGYTLPDHPHQRRIRAVLEAFTSETLGDDRRGTDGCSAPNWAISVTGLATAFAQLATLDGAAKPRRAVVERIFASCWAAPEMVAGEGRLDTRVMRALPGRVFIKTGAEGVYCGALPELGLGFAVKIADGAGRAAEAVTGAIIARLIQGGDACAGPTVLKNLRGTEVGLLRVAPELQRALDGIAI